ncbi:asb023 [Agrotis segetum nucleopolyhedrovirus B]|uniref:Asb023 n=1 Tax=Agrotis segetum nucleopolyhedrovirus B TaxID=1580580 RepID=A0A0A7KTA5_9ABAC|nr:asb023 [Agrotis segetum nucleopolyhedrovirus B]AIZ48581.1 asb023 [Agrotis segetum nucleopolyhedrovirus B]
MTSRIVYQTPDFDAAAKLILFSQHLLQEEDAIKTKAVLIDLASKGYHLCVVADRTVIMKKKFDLTTHYRERMKKTLMQLGCPVKFAHLEQFDGMRFAIDTDDFDRIDYDGPKETILLGNQKKRTAPKYVRNDFIRDYYRRLLY